MQPSARLPLHRNPRRPFSRTDPRIMYDPTMAKDGNSYLSDGGVPV